MLIKLGGLIGRRAVRGVHNIFVAVAMKIILRRP
jgi:hypothetical protein